MKSTNVLFVLVLVALLVTSSFLVFWASLEDDEDSEFFVGVQLGYGGVEDCKALVDKVKNYTNLFVISSNTIVLSETALDEVCDYIYESGLSFILCFPQSVAAYLHNLPNWLIMAKEKYGDQFLGEYVCDEPGGNQMDGGSPHFSYAVDYKEAASRYNMTVANEIDDYMNVGGEEITSDYCLYWFDYKVGYDVVLVEFAWNHSRPLNIALGRGAANVQNRDWGAMMTYTYWNPPYLESGPELYGDLVLAYDSGAKYAVVFNHEENAVYSGYGILKDEHFVALENFWNYMSENPHKHGSVRGETVLVLPEDYGFGFRGPDDKVWGLWESDTYTKQLWEDVNSLLGEYGSSLDIVYYDPEFNGKLEDYYDKVIYWSFEDSGSYPVQNLNTSFGYATIQEAITSGHTSSGDVIYVKAGTYYENLVIDKAVTLMGEDRETTIIDGGNAGTAITVDGSTNFWAHMSSNFTVSPINVTITGFTIRNGNGQTNEEDLFTSSWFVPDLFVPDLCAGIYLRFASNCNIVGNDIVDCGYAVYLTYSTNNTFRDNNIENCSICFWFDSSASINNIDYSNLVNGKKVYYLVNEKNLVIDQSTCLDIGFLALVNCTGMTVQNLDLDGVGECMLLVSTTNSTLSNNRIANSYCGIKLVSSSNNVLRNNSMTNNTYNFWVQDALVNDIDDSNMVNNKPVYYLVNQHNRTVTSDAGYVVLINCSNILVQNVDISSNRQGIWVLSTTNSTIVGNRLAGNDYGILIENCTGLNITGNELVNNDYGLCCSEVYSCEVSRNNIEHNEVTGIYLHESYSNNISANNVAKSEEGIYVEDGYYEENIDERIFNKIVGNNITENTVGIEIVTFQLHNIVYYNNFINNTQHVRDNYMGNSDTRAWDNGREGNYWSDHIGEDINNDGIAEMPYQISGTTQADPHPLVGMVSSFSTSAGDVFLISNVTVEDFQYFEANHTILMSVSGEAGFCRMVIPYTLMYPNDIAVTLDSGLTVVDPNYTVFDDGTQRWIYFAFPTGTQEITIAA